MHPLCNFSTKEKRSNYVCNLSKIPYFQTTAGRILRAAFQEELNVIKNKGRTYFVISATTRSFIDNLVDYYISEASSYKQMAKTYSEVVGDSSDTAFGIIIGSIYAAFIQSYTNQQQKPSLEDIQEFTQIVRKRAPQIKRGILDAQS